MNPFEERRVSAKEIRDAIASGSIETASRATLTKYITWLCTPLAQGEMAVGGEHEQVSELVRFHMLRSMIDAFEERSKIMQRWVLFFAALAIIATIMPYIIAPNPIFGATPPPKEPALGTAQNSAPFQKPIVTNPSQSQRPSTDQGVKQGTGQAKKENP